MISYLSPSSFALYQKSPEDYYLRYLATHRPSRMPQTQPMAIGSAFDAYAKSYLHDNLFGKGSNPKFDLKELFEAQVEEQNRTWAWEHGRYVFEQYKSTGALADLMLELQKGSTKPRFEFDALGVVNGYREGKERTIGEVPFFGKPDVFYITSKGIPVVLDFKVNGFCSDYPTYPAQGYVRMRSANNTNYGCHKKCCPDVVDGILINLAETLENIKPDWAAQLSIYSWLCGQPVGGNFVVAIDQVACSPSPGLPSIRVAEHRLKISSEYQNQLFEQCCQAWEIINSDWFFREVSPEESREKCKILDTMFEKKEYQSDLDEWFDNISRPR